MLCACGKNVAAKRLGESIKIASMVALVLMATPAFSDETVVEKAEKIAESAAKKSRQAVRKEKRKVRKKTGHPDRVKDVKEGAQKVGEDVSGQAKKTKRRID